MFFQDKLKEISRELFLKDSNFDLLNIFLSNKEIFMEFLWDFDFRLKKAENQKFQKLTRNFAFYAGSLKENLENMKKILDKISTDNVIDYLKELPADKQNVFLENTLQLLKIRLLLLLKEWNINSFFYFLAFYFKTKEEGRYNNLEKKTISLNVNNSFLQNSMGASFDFFNNRVELYCRSLWTNLSKNVLLNFISHEIGHYYFTFFDVLEKIKKKEKINDKKILLQRYLDILKEKVDNSLFPFVNIFEDIRVEKKMADISKNVEHIFKSYKNELFDLVLLSSSTSLEKRLAIDIDQGFDKFTFFSFICFYLRFFTNPQIYGFESNKEVNLAIKIALEERGLYEIYKKFIDDDENKEFLQDLWNTARSVSQSDDFFEVIEIVKKFKDKWFPDERLQQYMSNLKDLLQKLERLTGLSGKSLKKILEDIEEEINNENQKEKNANQRNNQKTKSIEKPLESELEKEMQECISYKRKKVLEELAKERDRIEDNIFRDSDAYGKGQKNSIKAKAEQVLCSLENSSLFFNQKIYIKDEELDSLFESYQNGYNFMKKEIKNIRGGSLVDKQENFELDKVGIRVDFKEYIKRTAEKKVIGKSNKNYLKNVYLTNLENFPIKRIHLVVDTSGSMGVVQNKARNVMAFIMGISDAITDTFKKTWGIDLFLIRGGESNKHYLFDFRMLTSAENNVNKKNYGLYAVSVLPKINFDAPSEGFSSYCYKKILSSDNKKDTLPDAVFIITDGYFVSVDDWKAIKTVKESDKKVGMCGLYFKETWSKEVVQNFNEAFDGYCIADEKNLKAFFAELLKAIYNKNRKLLPEDFRQIINLVNLKNQTTYELENLLAI